MSTSLPATPTPKRSDKEINQFFDKYFDKPLEFASNEVDAVVTFFEKRGFEKAAAIAISSTILKQAKLDNVKVFQILDTLKGLDEVQISAVVAEIINYSRPKYSTIGYKRTETSNKTERRNIRV